MKKYGRKHSKRLPVIVLVLMLLGALGVKLGPLEKTAETIDELLSVGENIEEQEGDSSQVASRAAEEPDANGVQDLSMHVIDVGQGLSLLFESDGHYLLYDGGDSDYSSKVVSYLQEQGVQTLDYVVASHYDADHLNGVVGALHAFEVDTVLAPDYETDTKIYQSFINTVVEKELDVIHPYAGVKYALGNSSFTVLAPEEEEYSDDNDYSIVLRFVCGKTSYLVSGDATTLSEEEMLAGGLELDSDIYVAGHHGSASSSSQEFLDAVSPDIAVISCKENNQYQHPSQEVMERLQAAAVQVYRTDKQGDFEISSDGAALTASTIPCNDYSCGEPEE